MNRPLDDVKGEERAESGRTTVGNSESSAERVRRLSDREIHFYLVGHTLFGIGFGAAFARHFPEYSGLCAMGGLIVGVILMAIVWKSMFRHKREGQE
jgi:hypothetical protein